MKLAALYFGVWFAGFLLPELLAIFSPRSLRIPVGMNFVAAFAACLILYGVTA